MIKNRPVMNKNIKKFITISIFLTAFVIVVFAEFPPWDVPPEANEIENPVEPDKKSLEAGKAFYDFNCKACHGESGLGDGVIPSGDFTAKKFTDQTDGAIFYKLQQGRGQMPSFKAAPETELWNVINYIRTFSEVKIDIVRKDATIVMEFEEGDSLNLVTARVYEILENGESTPASEIKVNFFVRRYFADMLIGGSRNYTDEKGTVSISFPDDLPGEDGILTVIARVEDFEFNPAETTEDIAWGTVKETYWNDDRQLWKNNENVPIWLLVLFFGTLGGILLTIGYVLMLVFKIFKAGAGHGA